MRKHFYSLQFVGADFQFQLSWPNGWKSWAKTHSKFADEHTINKVIELYYFAMGFQCKMLVLVGMVISMEFSDSKFNLPSSLDRDNKLL